MAQGIRWVDITYIVQNILSAHRHIVMLQILLSVPFENRKKKRDTAHGTRMSQFHLKFIFVFWGKSNEQTERTIVSRQSNGKNFVRNCGARSFSMPIIVCIFKLPIGVFQTFILNFLFLYLKTLYAVLSNIRRRAGRQNERQTFTEHLNIEQKQQRKA